MPILTPRRWVLGLAILVALLSGCVPVHDHALVVATSWPATDRSRIETEFSGWHETHTDPSARRPIAIRWLILAPGDDLEGLAIRRHPPDVLLGGPMPAYERIARANRLSALPINGSPGWAVSRDSVIHLVTTLGKGGEPADGGDHYGVAFDDPRNDPISLAWAEAQVAGSGFSAGYGRLVRDAADRRRIGRLAGSAIAAGQRGEASIAVGVSASDLARRDAVSIAWPEGVGVVAGARHRDEAMRFLRFLSETGRAGPPPAGPRPVSPDVEGLLAELLGATLVDAQDELWAAWAALERAGWPPAQVRSVTEPPPWPPASVAKILGRQGEQAMAMLEILTGQLATEPESRTWLISSWLSPPRPIDLQVLEELIRAADGRLIREPMFREWLRAEWTAWARQRYRRVLRSLGRAGGRGA